MKEKQNYNNELMTTLSILLLLALTYLSWNLPTDNSTSEPTPWFTTPTPE